MRYRPSKETIALLRELERSENDGPPTRAGKQNYVGTTPQIAIVHPTAYTGLPGLYRGVVSLLNASTLTWDDMPRACYCYEAAERTLNVDDPYMGIRYGDRGGLPVFAIPNCCGGHPSSECYGESCSGSGESSEDCTEHSAGSSSGGSGSGGPCTNDDTYYVCIPEGYCLPFGEYVLRRGRNSYTWTTSLVNGWEIVLVNSTLNEWHAAVNGPGGLRGSPYANYLGSWVCPDGGTFLRGRTESFCCDGMAVAPSIITFSNVEGCSSTSSVSSSSSSSSEESSSSGFGCVCVGPYCVTIAVGGEAEGCGDAFGAGGSYTMEDSVEHPCSFVGFNTAGSQATLTVIGDGSGPGLLEVSLNVIDGFGHHATYHSLDFTCDGGGTLALTGSDSSCVWPDTVEVVLGECESGSSSEESSSSSSSSSSEESSLESSSDESSSEGSSSSDSSSGDSSSSSSLPCPTPCDGCMGFMSQYYTITVSGLSAPYDLLNGTWTLTQDPGNPCQYINGSSEFGWIFNVDGELHGISTSPNSIIWNGSPVDCCSDVVVSYASFTGTDPGSPADVTVVHHDCCPSTGGGD